MPHAKMKLPACHVLRVKCNCAVVVVAPVPAEDSVLRIHLLPNFGAGKRGQDQRKSGLQTGFNGEISDLIKNIRCILIKTHHKCPHYTYLTIMKCLDTVGILIGLIGKFMHVIDSCLGERFESYIYAYATRFFHEVEH